MMTPAENDVVPGPQMIGQPGRWNLNAPSSLSMRIATQVRYRMFEMFMSEFHPTEAGVVLDVGVTDEDESVSESCNYFEARYPHKHRITGLGVEDASYLERTYPGVKFVRGSALEIPFEAGSFDYVHSAAVLEHVGNDRNQARMIEECFRVARKGVFLTTPNRWFPMEVHTAMPVLHWLPKPLHRSLLRKAGLPFWAEEKNLNLMTRRRLLDVAAAIPQWSAHVTCAHVLGWPSNLILIGHRSRD